MSVAVSERKFRVVNPYAPIVGARRAQRNARTAAAAKKNPLYLLGSSVAAANPHKGGHKVASKKKPAKKQPAARKVNSASARPLQKKYKPTKHARTGNPLSVGALSKPIDLLKFGLIALFGLVATRQVPQLALGTKNESWIGYLANVGTALGGAYGTSKFAGKSAGTAFGIGGGLYVVNRVLTDKFTPVGKVLSLAGVGDAQASSGLGRIVPGALYPPAFGPDGLPKLPASFVQAARAAIMPPPAAAAVMSGARGGRPARVTVS